MPTEAIVCGNKAYPNAVVATMVEDQYQTHLDVMDFVTVSNDLVGVPGMKKSIRRYKATDNKTEQLAIGEGNSEVITVDYEDEKYEVILLQNKFRYNDEQAMKDPMIVEVGTGHMATDMFNKANALCMAEFIKTSNEVVAPNGKFDFDAFVDGVAAFPALAQEAGQPELEIFGFINKDDLAEVRKEVQTALSQTEGYVRTGYVGTVNGVKLFSKADQPVGTITLATKKAVKYENKTGTQIEYDRDKDRRINDIISRKYGLFYLEDENHCVRLVRAKG